MATLQPIQNGNSNAQQPLPSHNPSEIPSEPPPAATEAAAADANPSTGEPESEPAPAPETAATTPPEKRWPGWPGHCVFRLIVPVVKVGSIIGRKGELVKKTCEETRARIRVLDAAAGTPDRIVLISGKEEPEAQFSPAMDAVIRIFKRVSGLSGTDGENKASGAAGVAFCSVRLLVASTQAINLIGKQGSLIKSIQENTGAAVRVLSGDERVVELQGKALKVLKALEGVIGNLRKFLVDQNVLPLFEKTYNGTTSQDRQADTWTDKPSLHSASQPSNVVDIPLSAKRDSLLVDHESQLDSLLPSSRMSLYGQDSSLSGLRSSALSRTGPPIVTTVIQTMQIPLSYAEDIIGIQGSNIDYIRRTSGAILTVHESRVPDEIIVEIKGTSPQVQMAQQLIQATRHAEMEAIDVLLQQWQKNGLSMPEVAENFSNCSLYVTCEPCIMCESALSILVKFHLERVSNVLAEYCHQKQSSSFEHSMNIQMCWIWSSNAPQASSTSDMKLTEFAYSLQLLIWLSAAASILNAMH